ncbi:MAG: Fic family protein [Spirochaetota bacterium]|nr:Fic family protein [Spirochaetota bacterium]
MEIHNTHHHISFTKRWTLSDKTLYNLGYCDSLIQVLSKIPILPDFHSQLLTISLRKGALATTAIEGNTLTEQDLENIDKGQNLPPSKEYLQIEVQNILNAFNDILKNKVRDGISHIITPQLIKDFHFLVGKDIGETFDSEPGKFRLRNVVVGNYKAPGYEEVDSMMDNLCRWLKKEFHFEHGQTFSESMIQAMVTHVYIAWIHPFSDGNGRSARLLEFYILMRAGLPDIASHILSNFYNETRAKYYLELQTASKNNDLTGFIDYAVQGFKDGLENTLNIIQENLLKISWEQYIYDYFETEKQLRGKGAAAIKRKRGLLLQLQTDNYLSINEILKSNSEIQFLYTHYKANTLKRDLKDLVTKDLVISENNKYKGNILLLRSRMPK